MQVFFIVSQPMERAVIYECIDQSNLFPTEMTASGTFLQVWCVDWRECLAICLNYIMAAILVRYLLEELDGLIAVLFRKLLPIVVFWCRIWAVCPNRFTMTYLLLIIFIFLLILTALMPSAPRVKCFEIFQKLIYFDELSTMKKSI